MRRDFQVLPRRVTVLFLLVIAIQPSPYAADKQQRKAKEPEAKRLTELGRTAEKQGRLLEARRQYLASEHVLFNTDAEKGLERIADLARERVKTMMADAAQAYAAENFAKAAQLLESAGALHPGNLAIGCNLALTRYQQDKRHEALWLLDQCVGSLQDKEPRRELAELYTALQTGDRLTVAAPAVKQQVARLNLAILRESDQDAASDEDEDDADKPPVSEAVLCAQMKALPTALVSHAAMLFNLGNCAESDGRLGDAARLLTEYIQTAPLAADVDEVRARVEVLNSLSALPDPKGTLVRTLYASAARHVEMRRYDQAIAAYQKADEAIPDFTESKRRLANLLQAQGQIDRARTYWQQIIPADTIEERRQQTQLLIDTLDAEKAKYEELIGAARELLHDLMGRSFLEGEPVSRIYAAHRLQLANERIQAAASLFPLASEVSLLQAFTCSQMNDFRCVRASFDAQRALTRPVSFYAAVFYSLPSNRAKQRRTYGKFEFENGTVRFAEISTVDPKKRTAQLSALVAGEDRLGHLGAADGLRSAKFQGFTVPATAIKRLENMEGLLYLEVDDRRVKRRRMLIEPLSLALPVPPIGPGARRHLNNYIDIADTYGAVEKAKLGEESTTVGEKLKIVSNIVSIGFDVTSVVFGNFMAVVDVATGVAGMGRNIALNQRQVQRLAWEQRHAVHGIPFKAIPTEPVRLAFRKELK